MKKTKFALTTLFLLNLFIASAQNQIGVIKKPEWNLISSTDSRYGNKVNNENSLSMIVNIPKADFAVVTIDDKMNQQWLTPLTGFPMAIGKFKNHVLVIAASDRSFFKSFTNTFKAYLLDEKTGKLLSDKIIYQGSEEYIEVPEFFFAEDGSYFKMASRLTAMKRKVHVALPIVGTFTALKMEKDYQSTVDYSIIDFNDKLEQVTKISPKMPSGDTWNASCSSDGSFVISTIDASNSKCNVALYLSNQTDPLKTVSIPVDFHKKPEISAVRFTASQSPLINYIAFVYRNAEKEQAAFISKINFKDGSYTSTKEVFTKAHVKELVNSYKPLNKKDGKLEFEKIEFFNIKHIKEHQGKLLVTLSEQYQTTYRYQVFNMEGSLLINVYDENMQPSYHQFFPASGSIVNLNKNSLRIFGTGTYGEMDLNTGNFVKINHISSKDINSKGDPNAGNISWLENSFVIPYTASKGVFSKEMDIQLLQMTY